MNISYYSFIFQFDFKVAERFKATVLKTVVFYNTVGSNPTLGFMVYLLLSFVF